MFATEYAVKVTDFARMAEDRGYESIFLGEHSHVPCNRRTPYPQGGIDLLPHMGKIVGIVGETRMDPALGLNIIAPTRVDEMRVTGGRIEVIQGTTEPTATPAAPAAPVPAGSTGAPQAKPAEAAPKAEPVATPEPSDSDMNK